MNAIITPQDVLLRFSQVRRAILTHRLLTALLAGVAVFVALTVVFATIDFFLELPRELCFAGLGVSLACGVATLLLLAKRAYRLGSRQRAAAEMERHFQSIGQRLRTTLDLAGRSGVDKLPLTLALASETNEECDAVDLESIVPRRQTLVTAVATFTLLLGAALLGLSAPMWSVAVSRVLGFDRAYTRWEVTPGDRTVDEGTPVEVEMTLSGRTDRDVKLFARVADEDADWSEIKVTSADKTAVKKKWGAGTASLSASLGQLRKPHEYQFVTSVGSSDIHRIDVRYPVRIEAIELTVKRPAYTGLEDRVFEKTDLTVLEGSEVVCQVRTQRPLDSVHIDYLPQSSEGDAPEKITAEKSDDGTQWSFRFAAFENASWTMLGTDALGTPMDPVEGKVRIKKDRPPKIRWSSPADSLFVHTLAEIPMNVTVEDDYGLSEAAIRFEISGNDGYKLAEFVAPLNDDGSPPTARTVLENILPLEHFPLTEKDYIAYYAYAIDNRPDDPHIVESERRYVDIRQLKIDILLRDDDGNNNNGDNNREALATLDELIGRQRYLINRSRTLRAMDADELSDKLGLLDRQVEKQSGLADLTRLVGQRLQERGNDNLEAMFQAEASMIQAADSLTLADFEAALPQQEDAQRFLVEARTEIQRQAGTGNVRSMSGNNNRSLLQMVRQRLRRRSNDNGEQEAQRNLVARIRAAAAEQLNIAANLSGGMSATSDPTPQDAPLSTDGIEADSQPPETASDTEPAQEESPEPMGDDSSQEEMSLPERQTALLDETTKIQEALSAMSWPSSLVPDRMEAVVQQMDEVTIEVNLESPAAEKVESQSNAIAKDLMELALNIELVNPPDPAGRLAGTRDLTATLVDLEQELANSPNDESDETEQEIGERAQAVMRRAETLVDVASAAADANDTESQVYADTLAQLMAEQPLLEMAKAAGAQAEEVEKTDPRGGGLQQTESERESRIEELAKLARSLDEALRQILEPELERLRQLEAAGAELEDQMEQENGVPEEEVLEFAEDLKKGQLGQAAEQVKQSIALSGSGDGTSLLNRAAGVRGAVRFANEQIRERIRELILRELEADRDGPVPPQYRSSVDDYFRRVIELGN